MPVKTEDKLGLTAARVEVGVSERGTESERKRKATLAHAVTSEEFDAYYFKPETLSPERRTIIDEIERGGGPARSAYLERRKRLHEEIALTRD